MLRAGALLYVLVIALLGAVLASSFLLSFYLDTKAADYYLTEYRMERDANSGIAWIMVKGKQLGENEEFPLEMDQDETKEILVSSKSWGIFRLGWCKVNYKGKVKRKAALIGGKDTREKPPTLFLADMKQPLMLCGETRLEGECYLPEQGLKRAYIEGQNYVGETLMYGVQRKSERELPLVDDGIFKKGLDYVQGRFSETDSLVSFSELTSDSISHSFFQKTLVIHSSGNLNLTKGFYSGNIIFYSSGKIMVDENARLNQVLLYAREIEIKSNNNSAFQAFAQENVTLKEKSKLVYPSVLGILNTKNYKKQDDNNDPLSVVLEKESECTGTLVALCEKYDPKIKLLIAMKEKTLLTGELYSMELAEIQGEVKGSVFCQRFYLKTTSSVYENYLLGAKISFAKRPKSFCGMQLKKENYKPLILEYVE